MTIKLYNNQVEIEFAEGSHRYKANGVYMIGVSTVLGILFKDLLDWAAWMSAEAFKEAITPYATSENRITKAELKKLADTAKKAHRVKSQRGKDVGSITHAWIQEEVSAGGVVEVPDYVADLLEHAKVEEIADITNHMKAAEHCVKQWRQWIKDYDVEIIKSEFIVHSRKLGYCGTCDVLFKSRRTGKTYIGDYKTSEPMKIRHWKTYAITGYKPYPEHFVQQTAYDYAHFEETGITPDGYMTIYLPKEGAYQAFTREDVLEDRKGWEQLFGTYKWIDKIRKAK